MKRPTVQMDASPGCIRIMYFITAPFLGGVHVGLRNILRELDRSAFAPLVVQPHDDRHLLVFFDEVSAPTATIRSGRLSRWNWSVPLDLALAVWDLCRLVRRYRIQIVHSTAPRAAILCLLVKWLSGVKFVWQVAVLGQSGFMRWLGRFPDRATCVSSAVYKQMGGSSRSTVQLLRNGVWTEDLSEAQCAARRQELRAELGIGEGTRVVGSVTNFVPWKGLHVLLRAFADVARCCPEVVLVHLGGPVPGSEAYAGEVSALLDTLRIRNRVRALGFRSDACRFYPVFDLFVHVPAFEAGSKVTEAFGQQVAEAMAYRLPVIASRCGGPVDTVEEGITGELIEPGNSRELTEKMLVLLSNPARCRRLGQAGYERFLRHFTIQREVREYEILYRELLGLRSSGRQMDSQPVWKEQA